MDAAGCGVDPGQVGLGLLDPGARHRAQHVVASRFEGLDVLGTPGATLALEHLGGVVAAGAFEGLFADEAA